MLTKFDQKFNYAFLTKLLINICKTKRVRVLEIVLMEIAVNFTPSSKVWHRCRSKPPNCRLARAARVVCAQPGTVVCSQTPLSLVVCQSRGVYVDSKVIA